MREFLNRLVDWFHRDRLERELAEELRFHRSLAERDARAEGASVSDAPFVARRRFGNATSAVEDSRDRWALPTLDHLAQDVRYALRGLRRSRGYTATAVITLSLGIGANVAMFGVVDRLMFRPFPFLRDPAATHAVYLRATHRGKEDWGYGGEYTRYLDLRRFTTSFSNLAGFAMQNLAVGTGDAARERRVATVSASFWDFFDAPPVRGRYFVASEDVTPRGAEVAVLDYTYWKNELAGRDVIGERLQVGNMLVTIIGVAPEGFTGVFEPAPPAMYIPITLYGGSNASKSDRETYYTQYHWGWMSTMVRRKPGVSVTQASADITQAFRKSWQAERDMDHSGESIAIAKPSGIVGPMKTAAGPNAPLAARTALWVTGVAVIVLIIACANVANLSLARALRRQRETAVRLALGVSRGRLIGQMLTESLVLTVSGAVGGLLVAHWGGAAIRRMLIATTDASLETFTDWRTLGAVAAIAIVAGLLAGIAPALLAGRGDLAATLKAGPREGTYHKSRLRVFLLVAQGALSVVLLIGATLFVRSLRHVQHFRMGYDAAPVVLVGINLRGMTLDSVQRVALRRDLLSRAQSIPGATSAAWVSSVPYWSTSSTSFYVAGIDSVNRLGRFTYQMTTPDYFATFGTRIVRGRGIEAADRDGAPLVAVVSESMARALWPTEDPIGKCMRMRKETAPCTTVVGVAEDIVQQQEQLTDPKRFQYYLPAEQVDPRAGSYVLVRMAVDAPAKTEQVRKALQPVMPGQSYVTVRPMVNLIDGAQRSWRLGANLFVAFGLLALVVAAVGLYGVMAYNVTQRMHELGVRVALGAQAWDILRLVAGQSARLTLTGVVVGSGLAYLAGHWVQPLLFEQSARDPMVYAVVAVLMIAVSLVASALPGRRATTADPNTALRSE